MNPTVPNMSGYDEVKIIITSLPVADEFLFFGPTSPCPYECTFSYLKRLFKDVGYNFDFSTSGFYLVE